MILVVDKIGEEVDNDCIPPGFEDIDDCFAKVDNVLDMDVVKALERLQLSMDRLCSPITVFRNNELGFRLQRGEANDVISRMQYEVLRLAKEMSFHEYASGTGDGMRIENLASGHPTDNKYWFYWQDEFMDFRCFMFNAMPVNDKAPTFIRVVKAFEVT